MENPGKEEKDGLMMASPSGRLARRAPWASTAITQSTTVGDGDMSTSCMKKRTSIGLKSAISRCSMSLIAKRKALNPSTGIRPRRRRTTSQSVTNSHLIRILIEKDGRKIRSPRSMRIRPMLSLQVAAWSNKLCGPDRSSSPISLGSRLEHQ